MIRTSLNGTWTLRETGGSAGIYPVTIPGSVLSALLEAGAVPDPFLTRNEYEVLPLLPPEKNSFDPLTLILSLRGSILSERSISTMSFFSMQTTCTAPGGFPSGAA